MNNLSENLARVIKREIGNEKLVLLPNHGNAGDSVIALGTIQFFADYNIPYLIDSSNTRSKNAIVAFAGGGSMTGYYKYSESKLNESLEKAKKVIILPHTIKEPPAFLKKRQHKTIIFSRELRTKKVVDEHLPASESHLAQDMAFYLSESQSIKEKTPLKINLLPCMLKGTLKQRMRPFVYYKSAASRYAAIRLKSKESSDLSCFRTDTESTNNNRPEYNFDISKIFMLGSETQAAIKLSSALFINSILQFDNVETDRLHCAITAALLGKRVNFYPNNYHKNQAVYNYSLKDQFPNVSWQGETT